LRFTLLAIAMMALVLGSNASAGEPRLDILKDVHSQYCPTEKPCNYCRFPLTGPYKFVGACGGPTNEAWGTPCRCKSPQGWQAGKVITIYPDKPLSVNF
jgi:hypothetical protein